MRFTFTAVPQQVTFGAGALDGLDAHLERLGAHRVLLIASGSSRRNGIVSGLRALLGERLIAVFDDAQSQVPEAILDRVLDLAVDSAPDLLLALGGGGVLGTAKALAVAYADRQPDATRAAPASRALPIVAIPTTYAGSEMTSIFGVTRTLEGRKVTVTDPRALPVLVLYDPLLTLDLPSETTAASAVNALAHCLEGLYSSTRNPVSTATALAGIASIKRALPRCLADGRDLAARSELLIGAHLAGSTIAHAQIGLHHGICHVLGGSAHVEHGLANAIMLPHVLRFNLEVCAAELAMVGCALQLATDGLSERAAAEAVVAEIDAFIASLGLPRRLREVAVSVDDLPRLAALASGSGAVRANPRPAGAVEIEEILRSAW